jgi:hypothetical protein
MYPPQDPNDLVKVPGCMERHMIGEGARVYGETHDLVKVPGCMERHMRAAF